MDEPSSLVDGWRLAFGTLTAIPVRPPHVVDRRSARTAMVIAPVAGLVLGLIAEAAVLAVRLSTASAALLAAAVGITVLAAGSRLMHLDGLADSADGLGSGQSGPLALEVMRASDVGAFGVVIVVLALVIQVAALDLAIAQGRGTLALVGGAVVSRLAITWTARRGVVPARADGLGAQIAGTVPLSIAAATSAVVFVLLAVAATLDDDVTARLQVGVVASALLALGGAAGVTRLATRRIGGVTGDTIGAAVEVAFTTYLVAVALLA
jgi:adenosylcobinamide-GDP ribazoletransferase